MEIVKYKQDFKQAFIDLNLAWLNKYFRVEPQDTEMLNGVDDLIERGAAVYCLSVLHKIRILHISASPRTRYGLIRSSVFQRRGFLHSQCTLSILRRPRLSP